MSSTAPKVTISIISYNNAEEALVCLDSVKQLAYGELTIYINPNGSKTGEIDKIQNWLKKATDKRFVFLDEEKKNLGFSAGHNQVIEKAIAQDSDYIILLNDDTVVTPNLVENMVAYGQSHPRIGLMGPIINEGLKNAYGGKISWLKAELVHIYDQKSLGSEPDFLTGACLCIKSEVINKIGMLDERFFLYFEDAEFCLRAHNAGFQMVVLPTLSINHAVSSTTSKLGSAILLYYHQRNALLFNLLHGPLWVRLALPFWSFYLIIKQILKIVALPSRRKVSKGILLGVIDFYRGKFGKSSLQE